jgi:hypothetical protein
VVINASDKIKSKLQSFLSAKINTTLNRKPYKVIDGCASLSEMEGTLTLGGDDIEKHYYGFQCQRNEEKDSYHDDEPQVHFLFSTPLYPDVAIELEMRAGSRYIEKDTYESYANVEIEIGDITSRYGNHLYNENCSNFFGILKGIASLRKALDKRRIECEKNAKAAALTQNTIDAWMEQIGKSMRLPYHIYKMETKTVFYVKLKNSTQAEISIPHKHFQELMPTLIETINTYIQLAENTKMKVIIKNSPVYDRTKWIQNG